MTSNSAASARAAASAATESSPIRDELAHANDASERLFVLGAWAAMTLIAAGFIGKFGSPIPFVDDWTHFGQMASDDGMTARWLWSQHNEHRYPLSSIMMWETWTWSGGDLRPAMLCGMLPLAAAAWWATRTARRLRGRAEFADAFFPLALLHLGHAENFLWFVQSFFVWASALAIVVICALADLGWTRRMAAIVGVGACLLLLPLQGAMGAAYLPAFACGFGLLALREARADDPRAKRRAALLVGFAVLGVLLVGAYFYDFHKVAHHQPPERTLAHLVATALQFLSTGLGPAAARLWPAVGVLTALAVAAGAAVSVGKVFSGPEDQRFRSLIMLTGLGGVLSLALGIAWGRGDALAGRYVVLAAPVWCWIYLAWINAPRPALARLVQMCLFALMCALSMYYVSMGLELGKTRQAMTNAVRDDIAAGVPLTGLAQWANYWCWDEQPFRDGLEFMRRSGVPFFAGIKDDPPMQEAALPPVPAEASEGSALADGWYALDPQRQVRFELDQPRFAYAVRLRYRLAAEVDPIRLIVSWRRDGVDDPRQAIGSREYVIKVANGPPLKTQTIWIGEPIRDVALSLAADAARVQPVEVTLLTRPEESPQP
jgi:hypothetical protein